MTDSGINLLETIIHQIPNDCIDPLEKARFIYIKLAQIVEFDTTFNNTTSFHRFLIKNKHYHLQNLEDTQIICHTWADIYAELLKLVGLYAYKVTKQHHSWVIIELDSMVIYADATYGSYSDLSRIKHCDEIVNFYPVSLEKTDGLPTRISVAGFSEYMNAIDKKIGYQQTQYNYLCQLKRNISSFSTLKEKMDYLLENANITNSGYYEESSYIHYLFYFCLSYEDRIHLRMSELKKTDEDGRVHIRKCISIEENDFYYYYIFQNDSGIRSVSREELMSYAKDSYGFTKDSDILGISEYPLTFQIPKNIFVYLLQNKFSFQRNSLSSTKEVLLEKNYK